MAGIEKTLKENGFLLALHIIENARSAGLLPASVYNGTVCGIISFNIYNRQYWQEVASLSIPSVFFDSPIDNRRFIGSTDIVIPENSRAVYELVAELHRSGRRNFGYLGDPYYCLSLLQRWQAFQGAVEETGLALNMNQCILDNFADTAYLEKFQIVNARIQ